MPNYRSQRVQEDIKRELTAVIRELKDPKIQETLLTVVRVDVSSDYSQCKVYVSTLKGMQKTEEVVKRLEKAKGFIRHTLSLRLQMRHTPDIVFFATASMEYSTSISQLLRELEQSES